jgi:hypothetical protein
MTERVDHDRLADFVGGALDGTPDAAAVRVLIETDSGWATAHADLVAATAAVSADLRSLGSRTHAVPEDVAARLDALLRPLESDRRAGGAPATVTGDGPGEPTVAGDGRAQSAPGGPARTAPHRAAPGTRGTGGTASAGPSGSSRPGGTGPGRRTRRMRWAAGLSAAAAVIAVGVGFVSMLPVAGNDPSASSRQDSAGGAAAPQLATSGPPVIVSGRDYRPGSFSDLDSGARSKAQPTPSPPGIAAEPEQGYAPGDPPTSAMDDATRAQVPPELLRLVAPDALRNCLDAIRLVHGGTPSVVEYARFTGRPALVVLLDGSTTGQGRRWVVVAGSDCGLAPGDVDELYNGPLA